MKFWQRRSMYLYNMDHATAKKAYANGYYHHPPPKFSIPSANYETKLLSFLVKLIRFWIFTFLLFMRFIWEDVLRPRSLYSKTKRRLVEWSSELVNSLLLHRTAKSGVGGHAHNFPKSCAYCFLRRCFLRAVAVGPVPRHVAFIMDGNRRFARENGLKMGSGHYAGFMSLLTVMDVCQEMGVKYVTFYAFSIDNFRRKPEFVSFLFAVLEEKLELLCKNRELLVGLGVKFNFVGDMKLMPETIQTMAQTVSEATKDSKGVVLSLVLAYTSTDEITRAAQESCREKLRASKSTELEEEIVNCAVDPTSERSADPTNGSITVEDLERHMYIYKAGLPDADILVRSSGETRLSNYLLWQTTNCLLVSPDELWPEMCAKTMVRTVLEYQKVHGYLKRKKALIPTK